MNVQYTINDDATEKSKWVIRIEIDPDSMLEKNITMDDINFALSNCYNQDISCVFSDYNSDKLVFRIRMNNFLIKVNADFKKWTKFIRSIRSKFIY